MAPIHLAEFQVRLLLCTPKVAGHASMHWECGCRARRAGRRRYGVVPCPEHARLLAEIREVEEPMYDLISGPTQTFEPASW
jgi:hypothetical protein